MIAGLVLAAGAGTRMGLPKALVEDESGPWLPRAVAALSDGGCEQVSVVLGAAPQAATLVPGTPVVIADDWADGMAASLRAGLSSLGPEPVAVVVTLVDLPDVGAPVVARLLAREVDATTLARAAYAGQPGHPVLIGRDHLPGVIATAEGDQGARDYLAAHRHELVECGDLAGGHDVDSR
ncbi:4-diphosphocytidyl-2C-methyl-D-erythritol synthase [metagenome]|uniref:4-diphosphocytidyl-2C-methyl-D-erythritol synthase n=1 Tax=metagenome TaxID=256318 RepID=A0A2P2C0S0_9ZZZZ